jgi:type III secretory pathway component EscT
VITFTEAQLAAWLSPIVWPFLRVLALFSVAPVFSIRSIPQRVKIGLAFFVAFAAQAGLAGQPLVSLNSPQALGAVVQQVGVGLSIGFAVRLVFTSVELAGELVGLQMGLNFASFFDPSSNTQVSAVSRFMGHMSTLLFVVMNGHLIVLMAVIKSFERFPVDGNFFDTLQHIKCPVDCSTNDRYAAVCQLGHGSYFPCRAADEHLFHRFPSHVDYGAGGRHYYFAHVGPTCYGVDGKGHRLVHRQMTVSWGHY